MIIPLLVLFYLLVSVLALVLVNMTKRILLVLVLINDS